VTFVAEGLMVGVGSFGRLAAGQVVATGALVALLAGPGGYSLRAVWGCFYVFNAIRCANALYGHFVSGPLAGRATRRAT